MTAREIFNNMTDEDLSNVYSVLTEVFEHYGHLNCISDDEMADLGVKLFGSDRCSVCGGSGFLDKVSNDECLSCNGTGEEYEL